MDPPADILAALEAVTHQPESALHFTPVLLRARIDGWTPQRQRRYVAAIAATGRADRAAALAGLTAQSAARLRHRPDAASFAAACCAAFTFAKQFSRTAAQRSKEKIRSTDFAPGNPNFMEPPNLPPARDEPSNANLWQASPRDPPTRHG